MKIILHYCSKVLPAILLSGGLWTSIQLQAQFAPPAGMPGTTAIFADSTVFVDWASTCSFQAGWMDISNESLGVVTYGTPENGIGKADDLVLSLGDGGVATCLFTTPLADGPDWDFAVFENSFDDTFLELAFVEVSSDGENFVRFPASSLTQTETQVLTFGILDATQLNNLAGKYRGRYGVPFDLNELSGESGLDINHIVAVRLVDVVGSISPLWQSFDQEGRIINDPWPTPFETGGFDLDAVGVIHNQNNTGILLVDAQNNFLIYPNPINGILFFQSERPVERLSVFSSSGKTVFQSENQQQLTIPTEDWPAGIYVARLVIENRILTSKLVKLK